MAWGKVDDNLAFHPKVIQAGNEAMGLWVRALSWSMQVLSDGHIPSGMVSAFCGDDAAKKLVDAGLWIEQNDGFQFRDWAEYQPTKETVLAERAAAKARMARVRGKNVTRIHENTGPGSLERSDVVRANITRSSASPTRPDPKVLKEPLDSAKRATRIPDDFSISPEMSKWAETTVPGLDLKSHTGIFVDYWQSASGQNAVKKDWNKAWQVWMRKEFMRTPIQQRSVNHTSLASDASRYCKHGWPKGECERGCDDA